MNKKDIKILLVDDEPDILEIVGYNLSNEGYQVITAENGLEGVKKAKKELPHLIILDVMMPEMDGIEACEIIRKNPDLKDTLITFLTARGEDYSQIAGFDVGADDYITKPIKPKVLISKINALLRRVDKVQNVASPTLKVGEIIIDREEYVIIKATSDVEIPDSFAKLLSADCAIFNWVDGDIDPYNFMADWATFSKIVLFWKWTDSYNNKDIPFGTDDTNNAELTSKWLDMVGVKYTTLDKLCNIQK